MTGRSLAFPGTDAHGREVVLSRGGRYRLTDGREAGITALQLGSGRRDAVGPIVRFTAAGERTEMRLARFCALVAEDLGPELPAGAAA